MNRYFMKASSIVIFLITFSALKSSAQDIDYKGFPQWSWHRQDSTEYYLYTPSEMEPGKKYPVALFMHGCCGTSYKATLRNTVDPPVRMWHQFGKNKQDIPTYIIAPATSQGWKQHFRNIKKVIDDLINTKNVDPMRIYVTGFSMGGDGTFAILQEYPGFFAAALPMGMSFRGDSSLVKNTPIWASQGETDWFARNLKKNVMQIRRLNGYAADTGATWITGVNPRYSNFKGVGHGVQWKAASTQDLTGWAYSRINDGNIRPSAYFDDPMYKEVVPEKSKVNLRVIAWDADGSVSAVKIYQNKRLKKVLRKSPYSAKLKMQPGDNLIEAEAVDNNGKSTVATTVIRVNIQPEILDNELPVAHTGENYAYKLKGKGNGEIIFNSDETSLTTGLKIYPDGTLKGYPIRSGIFDYNLKLTDEDGETVSKKLKLEIQPAATGSLIISNVRTLEGNTYPVRLLQEGESPFFNLEDTLLSSEMEEINFSDPGRYAGLHFIQTAVNDAQKSNSGFLQFEISTEAIVYIAYEKLDHTLSSTIPDWLKTFHKEEGEIIAQYRYFDVYSRVFPAGVVRLSAADAKTNRVGSNYFVILKKK